MIEKNFKEISQQIKVTRKEAGLTLEEFGEVVGVSKTYLSRIENGKQKPSMALLNMILEKYGVDVRLPQSSEAPTVEEASVNYFSKQLTKREGESNEALAERLRVLSNCGLLLLGIGSPHSSKSANLFGYVGLTGSSVRLAAANDEPLVGTKLMEIVRDNALWFAAGEPNGWEFEILRCYFDFLGDRTLEQWVECLRYLRWTRESIQVAVAEYRLEVSDARSA